MNTLTQQAMAHIYDDIATINALTPPCLRDEVKRLRADMREVPEVDTSDMPTPEELVAIDTRLGFHTEYKVPVITVDNYTSAWFDEDSGDMVRVSRSRRVGVVMGQVGERKLDLPVSGTFAHNRFLQGQGLTIEQIMEVDTRSEEQIRSLPALPTIEDILIRLRFIVRESARELGEVESSSDFRQGKSKAKSRAYFISQRLQDAVQRLRKAESLADYQPTRPKANR